MFPVPFDHFGDGRVDPLLMGFGFGSRPVVVPDISGWGFLLFADLLTDIVTLGTVLPIILPTFRMRTVAVVLRSAD
jgi:hypothetical protein